PRRGPSAEPGPPRRPGDLVGDGAGPGAHASLVGGGPWRLQFRTAPRARLAHTIDVWELNPLVIKETSTGT
ncbi:hypothetical protein ACFWN1_28385, partial [Streptomyces sp. NPDC058459]|uniref:hypothetical protein n=1 Tax=Streptomyces sp. NPDC058459 TaxID=3346508 RepID=UPI0036665DB9